MKIYRVIRKISVCIVGCAVAFLIYMFIQTGLLLAVILLLILLAACVIILGGAMPIHARLNYGYDECKDFFDNADVREAGRNEYTKSITSWEVYHKGDDLDYNDAFKRLLFNHARDKYLWLVYDRYVGFQCVYNRIPDVREIRLIIKYTNKLELVKTKNWGNLSVLRMTSRFAWEVKNANDD